MASKDPIMAIDQASLKFKCAIVDKFGDMAPKEANEKQYVYRE